MKKRAGGVILHITSLPGDYGMGTLGKNARQFVDFLDKSGQTYWQILPLVPSGEGDSPYMSPSSAAGNILLIDPENLVERGLLTWEELEDVRWHGTPDYVDFGFIRWHRVKMLRKAYSRIDKTDREAIEAFCEKNKSWLDDFALYMALTDYFGEGLQNWSDDAIKRREPEALKKYSEELEDEAGFYKFTQYLFFEQWRALKSYANERGIKVIGDIPIYVSPNSVDVWTSPEMFRLDEEMRLTALAGAPPDSFSAVGQLWGNPLYDWDYHEKTGYRWWIDRIRHSLEFYDKVRIDHFRGFSDYWEIPVGAQSIDGRWRDGPRMKIIDALLAQFPKSSFIAEDLGVMTDEALKFLKDADFTGMRVVVDSFMDTSGESAFLPHNAPENCVIYTSTHDTPTFTQWYWENATEEQRRFCSDYLHIHNSSVNWYAIAGAWQSHADIAMTTMQDVLGLGRDARMNLPGTLGFNWDWRVREDALNDSVAGTLRYVTKLYGRLKEDTPEE